MIKIIRDNSDNKDFIGLVKLLDEELNSRYGNGENEPRVIIKENLLKSLDYCRNIKN